MNKPLRALVVEDSEFDAVVLVNQLRQGGYAVTWERVQTAGGMREAANRVLAEDLGGERFVTAPLGRLDAPARRLVYANAGHPPAACSARRRTGYAR